MGLLEREEEDYPGMIPGNDLENSEDPKSILILKVPSGMILSRKVKGAFTNPDRGLFFEADDKKSTRFMIESMDLRFQDFFEWLGKHHVLINLIGRVNRDLYFVSGVSAAKVEVIDGSFAETDDDFLRCTISHIKSSVLQKYEEEIKGPLPEPMLNDITSIRNYLDCAGRTLPSNIRLWAARNVNICESEGISEQEKQHAMRALVLMLNVHWKSTYFSPIDPEKARKILDGELYGLSEVKQRVIETIIQINRTHTLPSYGLLLVGPAGTGKSRIAYAVAQILKIPFTVFDMSTVRDPEALTGTSRIYSNARPGRIMEAFGETGSSNLVFVINELDKASGDGKSGASADTLLTLLDNLGYTDNYMECQIPTNGVYTIATANDIDHISKPLLSRFSVIRIPDYTPQEKEIIFREFSLPKILRRLGMRNEECVVTDEAVKTIVSHFKDSTGCRDLEQAAEHIAGNALYQIETGGLSAVSYDSSAVQSLLL
ncbi:MAG: AAA family ATPase [Lachnospiraceae bacterium]|nr:AAA family ATPase [Lachnospiraceae bacterium]